MGLWGVLSIISVCCMFDGSYLHPCPNFKLANLCFQCHSLRTWFLNAACFCFIFFFFSEQMGSDTVCSQSDRCCFWGCSDARQNGWLVFDQAPLKTTIWLHIHSVYLPFPLTWKMSLWIMVDCFVSEPSPWCSPTRTAHPPWRGHDGFCSTFNSSANLNNKAKRWLAVMVMETEIL